VREVAPDEGAGRVDVVAELIEHPAPDRHGQRIGRLHRPGDLMLLIVVGLAYLAVVVLAIAAAARGALRVDPAIALRAE
jgi:hypothetical protein